MDDFGTLLRLYRQRSADPLSGRSLSQQRLGGLLLEEMGVGFSGAAVSDWERGASRIHADDRLLLVSLVKILRERGGIQTLAEANELLEAGNYRALNPIEAQKVFPNARFESNDPSWPNGQARRRLFTDAREEWTALLDKAREGPSPVWPRAVAAAMRSLQDRLSAFGLLRALAFLWLWLLIRILIAPSLRWPLTDRQETFKAAVLYVAGALILPAFIGLLTKTRNSKFWLENQLADSPVLRLYTHQGAFVGFYLGNFAIFLAVSILNYLEVQLVAWLELTLMLAPLVTGYIGARVIPYNLWRAYGRLNLRDGGIFFVFILLGPWWGLFLIQFSAVLTAPEGILVVLLALTLLVSGAAWQARRKA